MCHASVLLIAVVSLIGASPTSAHAIPQSQPQPDRPPLVECIGGEAIPCVEIVTQTSSIAGVWRHYYAGAELMAITEYDEDGNGQTRLNPQSEPIPDHSLTFLDGLAYIAGVERPGVAQECVAPGVYEVRRIRLGDQPVALTFHRVEDTCAGRISDTNRPMVFYTGADLGETVTSASIRAQALVPCPEAADVFVFPCDMIATSPKDITGIWRQYVEDPAFNAPGRMGYSRFNPDGRLMLSATIENLVTTGGVPPFGTISFRGTELTLTVDGDVPPECQSATYRFRIVRVGAQPVALIPEPLVDDCLRRRDGDMAEALIWIDAGWTRQTSY